MGATVLGHIVRRSIRSLWENLYLNTVAMGVISAALMLIGVYLVVQYNLNAILDTWDRDVHISAYFHPDVGEERRFSLRDSVAQDSSVEQVRYVSEADARVWMLEGVPDLAEVLDELGPAALPASLEITLVRSASSTPDVAAFVGQLEESDFSSVDYGQEWIERFNAFLSLLKLMGAVMGLLIVTATLFLVTNTIYLIVYNRRDELEIQKLVGATMLYIIGPFLVEGLIQGLMGALIALVGLGVVHKLIVVQLQSALQLGLAGSLQFLPLSWLIALALISVVLGGGAALVAVTRFLAKVP